MATIRIGYFKEPNVLFGNKLIQVPGEFISADKLSPSGASTATSTAIPDGTSMIKVLGDSNFLLKFGTSPTAADDGTCNFFEAGVSSWISLRDFTPGTDKIAVIDVTA
ncbi:MAG: hypothetical protein CUN56_00495 [Phototrophicales bacterium]|nr:MAG: hypothetical protein CUN56_00495 [Phototrophicales bacterium]